MSYRAPSEKVRFLPFRISSLHICFFSYILFSYYLVLFNLTVATVPARDTNRNQKFRNSDIARLRIRYSDGKQLVFPGKFRTNIVT